MMNQSTVIMFQLLTVNLKSREAKEPKQYIANGKVVWTDNVIKVAEKEVENVVNNTNNSSDLPF